MLKKGFIIFIALFSVAYAQIDNSNTTLFSIAGDNVTVEEFTRVYTKNNINNQADFSQKSLEEYLNLYKNFRLKVKEAEALGMDTVKAFQNELASYRNQLTPNYLTDRKATEHLVAEAYERMQEEVEASHILIFWPNANPTDADSLVVLKEIEKIRTAALSSGFQAQVKKYNNLNTSKYAGNKQKYESGNLGYVTVFQTVYPFENAMYNTPVGQISKPVATQFGYHLVYIKDKRPARGKMETAHLLVKSKTSDSPENQRIADEKVKQIYAEIKTGTLSFEEAVKKYSEDKKTKYQGGVLPALSGSQMLKTYADAVFALEKDGEITTPVKTKIGWHIIKRIKKDELPEFDYARAEIEKKVQKDSRSSVANELMIADTKKSFGFSENNVSISGMSAALKNILSEKRNIKTAVDNSPTLFTIGDRKLSQNDFFRSLKANRTLKTNTDEDYLAQRYNLFKTAEITQYREDHLEEIMPEFKNLMQEYHDGILLFELTNKEVWTKAVEDTLGLNTFFAKNRDKYIWKDRIAYTNFIAKDAKSAEKLKKFLAKGKTQEFILNKLNKKEEVVTAKEFKKEKESSDYVDKLEWTKNSITEEKNLDGSVKVTFVREVIAPTQKELTETRGYVISDYQDFLETEWIKTLSAKYPIVVNEDVFKSLIK